MSKLMCNVMSFIEKILVKVKNSEVVLNERSKMSILYTVIRNYSFRYKRNRTVGRNCVSLARKKAERIYIAYYYIGSRPYIYLPVHRCPLSILKSCSLSHKAEINIRNYCKIITDRNIHTREQVRG